MTKIVFPTEDQNGLESKLAEHFGRAPYFTVVELDAKTQASKVSSLSNTGEHFGGMGHAHDLLIELKPDAIVVFGMGPRGIMGFQSAGIAVLKATSHIIKENIDAYLDDNLPVLTEGCHDAHHQ